MRKRWLVSLLFIGAAALIVAGILLARRSPTNPPVAKDTEVGLTLAAQGFTNPTVITSIPGDKRLFVAERDGKVKVLLDGQVSPEPFIDLSAKVLSDGEMGLLGMVFHPKTSDGRVFFNYIDKQQNTIIASFQTTGFSAVDTSSEKALLKVAQPHSNHNGGDLHFGPDGYLYIALGDGGSGGDPENRAQRLDNYLGKILRVNVDEGNPYAIPADNPFVTTAGAKPEIWFYGLRNPWKFSFDQQTGGTWIADVGQGTKEEINLVPAGSKGGQNFGWRCFEGSDQFNQANCRSKDTYTFPVIEYDHSQERCSVTGGYVYRGDELTKLKNKYIYADYCGGQIYSANQVNGAWQSELLFDTPYQISAFGQDSTGKLFFTNFDSGDLYALTAAPQ